MTVTSGLQTAFSELRSSRDFTLLLGLTGVTIVEAVSYAWIEVLLYTSDNPVLSNTWLLGHYTTYHVVLAILVIAMVFGVGFFSAMLYDRRRFKKFMLLAAGDFILWTVLEDEFTFIFSGSRHTPTDWSSWILGSVYAFGYYVPTWYILALASTIFLWYLGLTSPD